MRFLVLDTETSALSPNQGQIIEVAGVAVEFNPTTLQLDIISEFVQFIKPRFEIDEKITRLTGITIEDLLPAHSLLEVQEKWASWLEKNEFTEAVVVGHSIDFDLNFLQHEGWYIPTGGVIDTLELSKLLLPDAQAVNLEFLIRFFDLSTQFSKLDIDGNQLQAHRALFDTRATVYLLLELTRRATQIPLSSGLISLIQQLGLLSFSAYPTALNAELFSVFSDFLKTHAQPEIHIDISGQVRGKTMQETIAVLLVSEAPKVAELWEKALEVHVQQGHVLAAQILGRLEVYVKTWLLFPHKNIKIHVHGQIEQTFLDSLISSSNKDNIETSSSLNPLQKSVLINPEQFISRMGYLAEKSINIGDLVNIAERALDVNAISISSRQAIEQFLTEYDFFLFALTPHWNYGQLFYNKNTFSPRQYRIIEKFHSLIHSVHNLARIIQADTFVTHTILQQHIIQNLSNLLDAIESFSLSVDAIYTFSLRGSNVVISVADTSFSPQQYLNTLLQKNHISSIETLLSAENLNILWKMIGVTIPEHLEIHTYELPSMIHEDVVDLPFFISELCARVEHSARWTVLLSGQSSSMKDLQFLLKKQGISTPSLIAGDDGSLTKIISKMGETSGGIAVLKAADAEYALKVVKTEYIGEIWLLNEPYLRLSDWWKNHSLQTSDAEQFQKHLKQLYTASVCAKIHAKTGKKVHFLRSYNR